MTVGLNTLRWGLTSRAERRGLTSRAELRDGVDWGPGPIRVGGSGLRAAEACGRKKVCIRYVIRPMMHMRKKKQEPYKNPFRAPNPVRKFNDSMQLVRCQTASKPKQHRDPYRLSRRSLTELVTFLSRASDHVRHCHGQGVKVCILRKPDCSFGVKGLGFGDLGFMGSEV